MAATVTDIRPGQQLVTATGGRYRLLPVERTADGELIRAHLPFKIAHVGVEIFGAADVDPREVFVDGKRAAEFGIRGSNGSHEGNLHDFGIVRAGHNIRWTMSDDCRIVNVWSEDSAVELYHLARLRRLYAENLNGKNAGLWRGPGGRNGWDDYDPDQRHGVYLADDSDNAEFNGVVIHNVKGSIFQANAASTNETLIGLKVTNLIGIGSSSDESGGTYHISLMGVTGAVFRNMRLEDGQGFVMMHSDGRGSKYACYDNRFEDYSITGEQAFEQKDGSRNNTHDPGQGFKPWTGAPVPPTPGTGPGQEEEIRKLQAQVNAQQLVIAGDRSVMSSAMLMLQDRLATPR